jgi:tetraacyldisaccharide 4'-kinase
MSEPWIQRFWCKKSLIHRVLYPVMWGFQAITYGRKLVLTQLKQRNFSVPIIIVGNLTTGGVGKTPLVIALAAQFKARGIRVGIVSRGYKARVSHFPYEVRADDLAEQVGDEPLLIAQKTIVPVVIAPRRVDAVAYLLKNHACQVIISDDGLQHYAMGRAIEIVVIDGIRQLGNQLCLPVGPLREPVSRLKSVDFVIVNGGDFETAYRMNLVPGEPLSLLGGHSLPVERFHEPIAAVAGIGNPQRFFNTLSSLQFTYRPYIFPDHYRFTAENFKNLSETIVMTEKDAVKCHAFATQKMYYLPVNAVIEHTFWDALWAHPSLKGLL